MTAQVLPAKYYLTHFHEFLSFIEGPCAALLDETDREFITNIHALPEDAQCLLVRTANRKSPFIPQNSLYYDELDDVEHHLQQLMELDWLSCIRPAHLPDCFGQMTKQDLFDLLDALELDYKRSLSKAALVEFTAAKVDFSAFASTPVWSRFVVRNFDEPLDYFLYLFFGDIHSRLNKFSMRDLGVMRTRKGEAANVARFDNIEEAKSAYFYTCSDRQSSTYDEAQALSDAQRLEKLPAPVGARAERYHSRYLFKLANKLGDAHPSLALSLWQTSNHPDATEKWIRAAYKQGLTDEVEAELNRIIDQPESEHLLVFAEDFLARKFRKKRTSVLTDMLRECEAPLTVDEMYRDHVERGVIELYQRRGWQAQHSENYLWRSLFGLAFWHILFEKDESALATEFDYRPRAVREKIFFDEFEADIRQVLEKMAEPARAIKLMTQACTQHYGKRNHLFQWHEGLLEQVNTFIRSAPSEAVAGHLETMARQVGDFTDGYPDLLVYTDKGVHFEEIKAPGDQLRKNQLLAIRQLRQAGFEVRVTQVEWFIDPTQPYAVVDIETTGGKAQYDRITEIGIVKVVNGEVVERWQSLVNPMRRIPKFITGLTGIDNHMVADAPLFSELREVLLEKFAGCVFVAHNVNFDYGFIRKEFERIGQTFVMPKLCTVREMRKAFPGLSSYSLANLTAHFDIDMTRHHRALSDAEAAAELLLMVNEKRLAQQAERQAE